MPSYTSKLALIKADGGENVNISQINENFDKIDAALGHEIVTSASRPAAPFEGQLIYETDTGFIRVRRGNEWLWAGGKVPFAEYQQKTGTQQVVTATNTMVDYRAADTTVFETPFIAKPATYPKGFVINEAGVYTIEVSSYMNTVHQSLIGIGSSSQPVPSNWYRGVVGGTESSHSLTTRLLKGDHVCHYIYQGSGSNKSFIRENNTPRISFAYKGI